ncbi:hypothetical protein GW17_00001630, partial [Ensete ventricosum]
VKKYSDWVVDGEYDWPPICILCNAAFEAGTDQTTRLGCLRMLLLTFAYLMHTHCLVSHIKSFSPQTPPAGYVCPACSSPVSCRYTGRSLPGGSAKNRLSAVDFGLLLVLQSGLEKNIFGNHLVSLPAVENHMPPPAFASDPLMHVSAVEDTEKGGATSVDPVEDSRRTLSLPVTHDKYSDEVYNSTIGVGSSNTIEPEIVEVDDPNALGNQFMQNEELHHVKSASLVSPRHVWQQWESCTTDWHSAALVKAYQKMSEAQ